MKAKTSMFFAFTVVIFSFVFLTAQTRGNTNLRKITRKVVSYNLYDKEYANEIDHIELEWSKTDGHWLPFSYLDRNDAIEVTTNPTPIYRMTQYNASNGATSTAVFNGQTKLVGDKYTLKMTIYPKDGRAGSLTFYGGVGNLGRDMFWNVTYLGSDFEKGGHMYNNYRGGSSWNTEGNLFWIWVDDNPVIPTSITIKEGDSNKLIFSDLVKDINVPLITIELDASFFP